MNFINGGVKMTVNEKIIQIIHAPKNMYAEYKDDDGNKLHVKIVCIGLTNSGDVVLMDMTDGDGIIDAVGSDITRVVFK